MTDLIDRQELLNNRPEYLNPQMEDEIESARHKGWNDCNSYYYDLIIKQPKVDTEQHAQMKKDCKNCIHDEICPIWDDYNDEPCKDGYRGFCHNYDKFKDKSQYIELPCKVGDKAYKVIRSEHFGNHIQEMTVKKFGMFAHTNFEMIFGMENNWDVFFDKSKAEEKLKELNEK